MMPVVMFIIDHPKGLVVFDTGNNVVISDGNCKSHWNSWICDALQPSQTREEVIDRQLEKVGYSVGDVKIVITSHSHLDHIGNIEMFPDAIHVIQKKELYQAWWPEKFQRGGRTSWPTMTTRATSRTSSWTAIMTCLATAAWSSSARRVIPSATSRSRCNWPIPARSS